MAVRVKEEGESEGRLVTGRIDIESLGNIMSGESQPTSLWSFLTRKSGKTTKGGKAR